MILSKEMSSSYGSTKKSAHTSFEYNRAKKVIDLRNTRNNLLKFLYQSADSYAEGSLLLTPTELERNLGDEYIKYLETHPEESRSSVKKVFEQHLLGRKKSQCNAIVEEEIVGRQLIRGDIYCKAEKERFEKFIEYETEEFIVHVCFEHGLFRGSTCISIQKKTD